MSLDSLRLQLTRKVTGTARGFADEWERTLRNTTPIDSGNMQSKTNVNVSASVGQVIITATVDTDYAHIVAKGQRPHVITPRTLGGVLAFESGGQTVFTRSVNHPGAQGNSWWDDALRRVPDMMQRNWRGA